MAGQAIAAADIADQIKEMIKAGATLAEIEAVYSGIEGANIYDLAPDKIEEFIVLDKETLIGTPFMILEWNFRSGNQGPYVQCKIESRSGQRANISDGGKGIYRQLVDITNAREDAGHPTPQMMRDVAGGLTVSKYDHPEYGPSETFYLNFNSR